MNNELNLYRKYRPQEFEDMIGNESEIKTFKKILEKKDGRPHSFLLVGPSGCGKTTLARIASKKLGADELSIMEINSADNRGIDTARDIIQRLQYVPPGSGVMVFIIDELHQTSKDWQNAMLKPLEDTPKHVYFFLCTTDPSKLIPTLKNRCTQIKVTLQEENVLYKFLRRIVIKENLEISKEIIQEISENCSGSPRLALVLLEKILGLSDEKEMREVISIGEEAEKETIELCRALLSGKDWNNIKDILNQLKGKDIENIRYAVLGYMNAVLLKSGNRKAALIIECFSEPFYNNGKAGLSLACYQSLGG